MPIEKRDRFNLETMSGIFPGTRTKVFQRVVLDDAIAPNAQVAWYDDPVACVVAVDGTDDPLLRVEANLGNKAGRAKFWVELLAGLGKADRELRVCGSCSHWQETAAVTADGLVLGSCTLGNVRSVDKAVVRQSVLALACSHWCQPEAQITPSHPVTDERAETSPPHEIEHATGDAAEQPSANAELDGTLFLEAEAKAEGRSEIEGQLGDSGKRAGLFSRLKNLFGQNPSPSPQPKPLLERSGVGAGTESCFACQGRIANLGALVTQTDEGDAQTFSVWRCRVCHTFYLNRWVDRWVRLDNLETEEVYYRVAPSEALALLSEIDSVHNAEHPAARAERGAQNEKFMGFVAERSPLSHQIKHGR